MYCHLDLTARCKSVAAKDFFLLFPFSKPLYKRGEFSPNVPLGAWWTRFSRVTRQASWTAEGRRAGREGRNPLHGANAPSVSWHWPRRLKQGLGSTCCVEVSPGDNNSGENSPRAEETHKGDTQNETTLEQGSPIQKSILSIDRRCSRPVVGGTCLRPRCLPLGERGQRPAAGVHQHYRAWPLFGRHRGVRPDLRLRRRRLEASPRSRSFRGWHGHRRRQLHGLALSVRRSVAKIT